MAITERIIPPKVAEDGSIHYTSVMSPSDDSIAICHVVPTRVIPVIFVPGVMGSNLEDMAENIVWDVSSEKSLGPWLLYGPIPRKKILDPNKVRVSEQGELPPGTALSDVEKRRRGWTTVSKMYYGNFLVWLENTLNDCRVDTNYGKDGLRKQLVKKLIAPGLGELTNDEVNLSYRYQLPVHAVGYNWLQSNSLSAQHLNKKIDEFTKFYRDKYNWKCEKVVVITHSMGGLVARYCSEVIGGGRDKILGMVHGVMPATGAATAYQHVRGGNHAPATSTIVDWVKAKATSRVLGATGAEVTPVFAQSPGPLQLLPSMDYGKGWLKIRDGNQLISLPGTEPYTEIYTKRGKWWGLVNEDLMDPDKKVPHNANWTSFVECINNEVASFHTAISKKYHPHTYAFCGDDDSGNFKAWGEVVWKRTGKPAFGISSSTKVMDKPMYKDNALGEVLVEEAKFGPAATYGTFEIQPASDSGDGTVPGVSGRAPRPYVSAFAAFKNVDHAGAYKVADVMTQPQRFSLWGIVKVLQNIKGTALAYSD
ncbi:esterase/lipase family protein [Burkholderia sp. AW49-1]